MGLGFGFGFSFFGSVFGGGVSDTRSLGSVGSAGRMDVGMSDVCSSEKVSRPCWGRIVIVEVGVVVSGGGGERGTRSGCPGLVGGGYA